jgi:TnpA family transposase
MPVSFLSAAERDRLGRFPDPIAPEDLSTYFTLSQQDLTEVNRRRRDHNRLGFALQICALRYLGFCPENLTTAPCEAIIYVAQQVGVAPEALFDYGERTQTGRQHSLEARSYLGFRRVTGEDFEALSAWLVERALEHDRPTLLLQMLSERLYAEKIVRPGVTRLERLVATARQAAQQAIFHRLNHVLSSEKMATLDRLLTLDEQTGRVPHTWLRRGATANSPRAILATLEKLAFVRQWEVEIWDLDALNPNRLKLLAQIGRRSTAQALQRAPAERRYPILAAFLWRSHEDLIDEVIDQYDRCLAEAHGRARRDLEDFRQRMARATNQTLHLFQKIGSILLDPGVPDGEVRSAVYTYISPERLQATLEESERIIRPADDSYFDFLERRYSYVRQFAPAFMQALTFRANRPDDLLLEAVHLLRDLNRERKRLVPEGATLEFMAARWLPYVLQPDGTIDRHYYELCVLWQLRGALRAGDIWVEGSRRYADPETYLIPANRWPALRPEVCRLVGTPADGAQRLWERRAELEEQLARLDEELPDNEHVRVQDGQIVVSPLVAAEVPESSQRLQALITEQLPHVELAELLIEVDSWTDFSGHFQHAAGSPTRTEDLRLYLYATILAQACNLGLSTMAELAGLPLHRLIWYANWYVREETLRAATTEIVNFQYHQPLSQHWGGGTLSSSDGQRFPVSVQTRMATALPRYFGYGRGLTFYTWTSDQFSQYGTKVIPATVRDATYVLDEILDNETELPIVEHTTDTAGYTELVFALFDLLGLQFAPRIRDLGEQRLYRMDRAIHYRHLDPLLRRAINQGRILDRWDDLLRVTGSLKLGWVTASLLIGKLQAFPRQNALTRALQEYGRLAKTLFILRYLRSEAYRRQIGIQLNKGEALHALRRFLFFANLGRIRRKQPDEQMNQAGCLNLVTNAVVAWNTVYMAEVIRQLEVEGHPVQEEDLAHLSPARYEHVNPYGKYHFDIEGGLNRQGLRLLRKPTGP